MILLLFVDQISLDNSRIDHKETCAHKCVKSKQTPVSRKYSFKYPWNISRNISKICLLLIKTDFISLFLPIDKDWIVKVIECKKTSIN